MREPIAKVDGSHQPGQSWSGCLTEARYLVPAALRPWLQYAHRIGTMGPLFGLEIDELVCEETTDSCALSGSLAQ
ncbi:hypothetical protein DFR24_4354 [Panacagrimonas perspica]|uniref:Uncharacterized protein n=1 Tax=Panacagrimonas perspica TaxID=381431 RepID=A0A4R7NYH6_9GAMM|nr:hypothetical protein DFR24_4354 [Panacagrimonas perspica]